MRTPKKGIKMYSTWQGRTWHWLLLILIAFVSFIFQIGQDEVVARLDALEAASTCAQQPKKHHYLDSLQAVVDSKMIAVSYNSGYNDGLRYCVGKLKDISK